MELNTSYRLYYSLQGSYIEGLLVEEASEYYVLQNAKKYIAGTQAAIQIKSNDDKCFVSKAQILYLIHI